MLISRARLLFALLVLLGTSLVSAQSNPFLSSPQALNVGQTFSLEWTPTTSGPVTLTLVSGLANDTTVVSLIASKATFLIGSPLQMADQRVQALYRTAANTSGLLRATHLQDIIIMSNFIPMLT